ncbi:hypothetical protein HNP40_003137 [Mycobacteroides chelonae]|nr:hypothetical protein [Mycobacteroides chelonae]
MTTARCAIGYRDDVGDRDLSLDVVGSAAHGNLISLYAKAMTKIWWSGARCLFVGANRLR